MQWITCFAHIFWRFFSHSLDFLFTTNPFKLFSDFKILSLKVYNLKRLQTINFINFIQLSWDKISFEIYLVNIFLWMQCLATKHWNWLKIWPVIAMTRCPHIVMNWSKKWSERWMNSTLKSKSLCKYWISEVPN